MWCYLEHKGQQWEYCDKLSNKQVNNLIKNAIKPNMKNFKYGVQSDGKGFKPYTEFDSCLDFCENKFTQNEPKCCSMVTKISTKMKEFHCSGAHKNMQNDFEEEYGDLRFSYECDLKIQIKYASYMKLGLGLIMGTLY